MMYLNDLQGFIQRGFDKIDLNDQGKYPYISFGHENFEREKEASTFGSDYFPFVQIKVDDGKSFNVSEHNLISVFTYVPDSRANKKKITNNQSFEITLTIIEQLKQNYYKGYLDGHSNFLYEIGVSFPMFDIPTKKIALEDFGKYCFSVLYFEGFATPRCLYILGYINACYFRAWKEYNNLNNITKKVNNDFGIKTGKANGQIFEEESNTLWARNEQVNGFKTDKLHKQKNNSADTVENLIEDKFPKLQLTSFVDDICNMWMILTEIHNIPEFEKCTEYSKKEDVMNLLGMMFKDNLNPPMLPNIKFVFQSLPLDYREILYLLGHATYKLSRGIDLKEMAKCLNSTFSCCNPDLVTIGKTITKTRESTIASINKLNTEISRNAIKTLRKIPNYGVKAG